MFKRARWASIGYLAGIGTSVYVARRAKEVARRYTPPELAGRVSDSVSATGDRLRDAIAEGRAAMREREGELRREVQQRANRPGARTTQR
jgi:hypothetical protein